MPITKTATKEEMEAVLYPFKQRGIGMDALRRKYKRTNPKTLKYIKIYDYICH